ncbi:MAG: MerR family transcriptional regulator [Armatimonadetes bacterium]|nr:MerR family transcriptional regulator [Armatimonadota bacterium]
MGTQPMESVQSMPQQQRNGKTGQLVSISLASRITGVEVHTLRYWEREFSGYLEPERTQGGQRRYRPEDIQTVFTLKRLLRDEMFSIAGARKFLRRQIADAA